MMISEGLMTTIVLILVYKAYQWWQKWKSFYAKAAEIPGPFALPLMGNLIDAVKCNFDSLAVTRVLQKWEGKDGIVRCWSGSDLMVFLSHPDFIETFHNSKALFNRSIDYRTVDEWFGEANVITADGERWKRSRRIMLQSFHTISQAVFVSSMVKQSKNLIEILREKSKGGAPFQFTPIMRSSANALIARVAIDEAMNDEREVIKVLNSIDDLLVISLKRLMSPLHYYKKVFPFTTDGRNFFKMGDKLRSVISKLIEEKRVEMKGMIARGETVPNRYIYNLLEKFGDEPLDELTTHMIGVFITAVDTTTSTTGFILLIAGILQDVQQKIYEEDQEIMKMAEGQELTPSDLLKYDYLDRVIKETLRYFPVGALVGRTASEDVQFGKYTVPAGANVYANPLWTRYREDVFEDPYKFDPDRFLPENVDKLHSYAYLPFSTGPKACAGTTFAITSLKVAVAAIIRNFKVYSEYKSLQEVEKNLLWTITLKDKNLVRIRLEPRS